MIESISVVLRRQVPVRDEPVRSWIGGLPMMPANVDWPVGPTIDYPERGMTPLHFVAQIACADLPAELWGGLGPRSGWLLLFFNAQDWTVEEDSQAVRVLHISELGPERKPPPGIFPVHDEMYSGPDYCFVRSQDDIPVSWRRWPVNLVVIPNRAIEGKRHPTIIPENFASILYDGAPVREGRVDPPTMVPFTWRGLLYVVDSVARVLSKEHRLKLDGAHEKLVTPGWATEAAAAINKELAGWMKASVIHNPPYVPSDDRDRRALEAAEARGLKTMERLRSARQLIVDSADGMTVLTRIEQSHQDFAGWREAALQRVETLREQILAHDLDAAVPIGDWEVLQKILENDRQPYWILRRADRATLLPELIDRSLLDYADDGLRAAQVELAADYYVSPELRNLVPTELVRCMEPHWRSLYNNRPHRMGGTYDGIQSDATERPTGSVLLFQIATDSAMNWMWGDVGAYYVFIDTDRLAAGDFSKLDCLFECH
ncbi:DUF1963 domain-containing protein [Mesorhizobium sp. LHD-90]|uniref:DUF1963 domain-containing protein n=1 Tax=Mesorhizobium sp. LHD-90 TaxID=3071414 RepID=UPI0027DFFEDD|nr:DUF1963 domain-containing protein [Mesorhizobium sp. LHD-90]MDQ6438223.1 DUF1963 domain-containing protein [Mesorhizobium sp. LHD-90]